MSKGEEENSWAKGASSSPSSAAGNSQVQNLLLKQKLFKIFKSLHFKSNTKQGHHLTQQRESMRTSRKETKTEEPILQVGGSRGPLVPSCVTPDLKTSGRFLDWCRLAVLLRGQQSLSYSQESTGFVPVKFKKFVGNVEVAGLGRGEKGRTKTKPKGNILM